GAWQDRSHLFCGKAGIPLIANSHWTLDMARQRYSTGARTDMIHLGLDHLLFAPIPKAILRRLLKLPVGKTIIAMGAVDVEDQWKGGPVFDAVYRALRERNDVALVLFGRASERLRSARSLGLIEDERLMPLIFNVADIFVSTATAESF